MMPFYLLPPSRGPERREARDYTPPTFHGWRNEPPNGEGWVRKVTTSLALFALGVALGVLLVRHECPTLQENAGNLQRAESLEVEARK